MDVDRSKFDEWYKQEIPSGQKTENVEFAWQAFRAGHALGLKAEQDKQQQQPERETGTLGVPPQQARR